jgi:hypothetical protein
VIFESGGSLLAMIEARTVELDGTFDIFLGEWDGVMSFPGYSVSIVPGVDDLFQLMKNN